MEYEILKKPFRCITVANVVVMCVTDPWQMAPSGIYCGLFFGHHIIVVLSSFLTFFLVLGNCLKIEGDL